MNESDESEMEKVVGTNGDGAAAAGGALRDLVEALDGGRHSEAVALFLSTSVRAAVPRTKNLLSDVQTAIGETRAHELVAAFASLKCLYCHRGFSRCERCEGSGRAEVPTDACLSCSGLGAARCDFCGGSGLATYNFVPAGLRAAVASVRSQSAVAQVDKWGGAPFAPARGLGAAAARKAVVEELTKTSRIVAILKNASELALRLRRANPNARKFTHGLFTRSARGARLAQIRLAVLHQHLAKLTQAIADAAEDEQVAAFERDRAARFMQDGRAIGDAARRRSALFSGR
jgi:hypothetical protein